MSHFPMDWNLDSRQGTENETFEDDESELTDAIMDIDIDRLESDHTSTLNPGSQPERFSAQYLLPLEVRYRPWLCTLPYAATDELQLVEMIAINIADDADLMNFVLTCKDFASAAVLEKSTVWRTRFLALYDHPIIEGPYEFRIAYQLRELVLRKFPSFANGDESRCRVALEILRDMVLGMCLPTIIKGSLADESGALSSFYQTLTSCILLQKHTTVQKARIAPILGI
jgi:hypothetical protein